MGRPKEPDNKVTKWAIWKRAQRNSRPGSNCAKCGKKVSGRSAHRAHTRKNGVRAGGGTRTLCPSCHLKEGRSRGEV